VSLLSLLLSAPTFGWQAVVCSNERAGPHALWRASGVLAKAARRGEDRGMPPDQGCYEERYRLTFPVAQSAAISFVVLIPALFSHQPLPWLILFLLGFVLSTVPWVLAVASRKIAFRADMAGITLGADPLSWPFRHASAVSVPWADVEGIVLYPGGGSVGWGSKETLGIGIQRRPGAPALPRAISQLAAARCPVLSPGPSARSAPGGWTASVLPRSPRPWLPPSPSPTRALARTQVLKGRAKQVVPRSPDPRIKRQARPYSNSSESVRPPDLSLAYPLGAVRPNPALCNGVAARVAALRRARRGDGCADRSTSDRHCVGCPA